MFRILLQMCDGCRPVTRLNENGEPVDCTGQTRAPHELLLAATLMKLARGDVYDAMQWDCDDAISALTHRAFFHKFVNQIASDDIFNAYVCFPMEQ